jgi:hypothetical protein
MPLARIQRSFPSLPLTLVTIRDTFGTPARIYSDVAGRFPSETIGSTFTSSTGLLDIYVDDSKTYNLEFRANGVVLERINGVDPQGLIETQNPSPVPGDGIAVATSRTALATDNGRTVELSTGVTYTLTGAVPLPAGVSFVGPVSGAASVAASGGATLNGGATPVSIPAGKLAAAVPRASDLTAFLVSVQG